MVEFKESKFYKLLQDFFINNDKETFLQMLAEFYNRTEGIIIKNDTQDELIKELREMFLLFNEEGIDENIVREKVNYFIENSNKIQDIITKIIKNANNIKNITSELDTNMKKNDVFSNAKYMPNGFISFVPNDVSKADANSEALQFYLDNANTLENQTIKFGKGDYYFSKGVIKRIKSLIKIQGNSETAHGNGMTSLNFIGENTFISIGEDDGKPENSNLYNGVGGVWFKDLLISGTNTGTLNNGANYGVGQYGIRDYRGGSLQFENVTIQQFECGIWAIESDYNSFYDLILRANKKGMYLGARSDQQTIIGLNTYNNELAVEFNGCSGVVLINPYFVGNTDLRGQILVNNSKSSTDVTILKGWFEMHGINNVTQYAEDIIGVGIDTNDKYNLTVTIDSPTINNSKHKHVVGLNFASLITFKNVATNGYHNLFNFKGTAETTNNRYSTVNLDNSPTNKGGKDFTITGVSELIRITGISNSYGVQQLHCGYQNRLDFINPLGSNVLEMFLDYGTTGLRFNHQSFNGGKYLQFQRRIFYSSSKPSETNINYKKGDICFNTNVNSGGYVGWVCITDGSPGTWKGFGLVES